MEEMRDAREAKKEQPTPKINEKRIEAMKTQSAKKLFDQLEKEQEEEGTIWADILSSDEDWFLCNSEIVKYVARYSRRNQ